MMANETKGKNSQQAPAAPRVEAAETAQRIHTMVQLIYAELAVTRPWLAPVLSAGGLMQAMPGGRPNVSTSWQPSLPWLW